MTTTTLPRLPYDMTKGGATVAVRTGPVTEDTLAHRPTWTRVKPDDKYDLRSILTAACAPQGAECVALSAGWADHLGAAACTATACFPDAEPR